jgi:hypothetical protein
MSNEILFAGGGFETLSSHSNAYASTAASYFTAAYSDHAIILDTNGGAWAEILLRTGSLLSLGSVVSAETLWVHAHVGCEGGAVTSSNPLIELRNSSGHPWFRFVSIVAGSLQPQWNSGTGASPVWTSVGSSVPAADNEKVNYDISITLGSPHTFNVYKANSLISSGSFTQASLTSLDRVRFGSSHSSSGGFVGTGISQILCTEGIPTVGAIVPTVKATGAGANTGWSGAFSDVNEIGINDTTTQAAVSAGLKSTHAMGDITVPAGFEIRSVFNWTRAKNDGTAPNNLKSVIRQGGVDYSSGDVANIGLGYGPVGARYDTAPDSSNWTQAIFNAIEAGYESAT